MPNSDSLFAQLERLTETFPQSKLQAAVEQRDAITPLLLEELHQMAADPAAMEQLPEDYMRHIYAIYLLAQFREQAAYEPLLTFLSTPGELVMDMMQDVVTEDLGRILASIFAGDLAPIKALIENPGANEWVRSGALDTLGVLYCEGQLPRDEYQAYLHELFTHRIERKHSHLWATVVIAASDMRAVELLPEIQRAFDDELVDLFVIDFAGAKELTQRETDDIGELWLTGAKGLIGPIVEEIGWWACFNEADDALDELPEAIPEVAFEPSNGKTETVYSEPKVGRNDSCPCGSGKKYKKCCLG